MSAFRAVVFDYDGTLFDTRPAIVHCIEQTFRIAGRPVPARADIARTVASGITLHDTFSLLDDALRHDRATLNEQVRTYRSLYLGEGTSLIKPVPGAAEAVRRLHDSGKICIIVSNKGAVAIHRSLEDNRLNGSIDLVLADEGGLPRKPDPALVKDHILPRFPHLQSAAILMVGDTEADIQFAKASGMPCCWVSYGYGDAERCRALQPAYEITSLTELDDIVAGAGSARPRR